MRIFLLTLLILEFSLSLTPIDINTPKKISILKSCDIKKDKIFKQFNKEHLNLGVSQNQITIKCSFKNSSSKSVTRVLYFSSPLLEEILYLDSNKTIKKGVFLNKNHNTIAHYFYINLPPNSKKETTFKVKTLYTPLDFSIFIEKEKNFFEKDRLNQSFSIFFIGIITALMLYAFIIGVYSKENSYIFYSLYLVALIFHQLTYIGLTQIYMPLWFAIFDAKITIIKISLLIVTSALFARSFLYTKRLKSLDFIYKVIILIATLEAIFLTPTQKLSLYIIILTGAFFLVFNLIAGILVYLNGQKEARLFILGFSIVFIAYFLIIIDALGLSSVMQNNKNILIVTTTIEALILSLAFADKFAILQKEKIKADKKLLLEATNREKIIKEEVEKKTKELNDALKEKEILMQEIHHRVKNNLQIILSMIRLQNDSISIKAVKESLVKLENRVNAIAKSYSALLSKDSLQTVDMKSYIGALLEDLVVILGNSKKVEIKQNIQIELPFKKAVYIGLIVNELVTNAFKYAFKDDGVISINLLRDGNFNILEVKDNGIGFNSSKSNHSLGLKLIYSIVKNQLKGDITIDSNNKTYCLIRF